jgi:hypothetical protein
VEDELVLALFARANHPKQGWDFAHGYVVIGVKCETVAELAAVRQKIEQEGCRLPDAYRVTHLPPDEPIDWSKHEWYSGGPHAFDYLCTLDAPLRYDPGGTPRALYGSRGDNRFFWIYTAEQVLEDSHPPPAG